MSGTLVLSGDVAADQITKRIHGFIRDAVIDAGAAAFARDEAMARQVRQVARDVGGRVAAELGELADVSLAIAQQVEDLQAGRLGQDLEIGCHLIERLGGKSFHSGTGKSRRARMMPQHVVHLKKMQLAT